MKNTVNKMWIKVCAILIIIVIITNASNILVAATYSFNFTANQLEANKGDTITLTITANGLTGNVKLSSNNASLSDSQKWVEKNTVTITAKITNFPATITATPVELTDNDYNIVSISPKTVTIKEKPGQTSSGGGTQAGNQGQTENKPNEGQSGGQTNQGQTGSEGNQGSQTNQGSQANQNQQPSRPQNQGNAQVTKPNQNNSNNNNSPNNVSGNNQHITKSSNNYLKSLSTNIGTLTPEFYRETFDYTIDNIIEDEIEISAEAEDEKASVDGTGSIALSEGENKLTIDVRAENEQVRTYTIIVNKKETLKESDLRLKSLEIQTINEKNEFNNIDLEFSKEKFDYNLDVEDNITDLSILPTVEKEGIIVEIKGDKNLSEGENNVDIVLTNQEDEAIKTTYTIKVNRKAKPIVEVSANTNKLSNKTIYIIMGIIILAAVIVCAIILIIKNKKR